MLSTLLIIWMYQAQERLFSALKYRAAFLTGIRSSHLLVRLNALSRGIAFIGNVAVVKGIGRYPSIFNNATPDHLMALRQRRSPVAVNDVAALLVPLSIAGVTSRNDVPLAAKDSEHIHMKIQCTTSIMLTVLYGVDIVRLKKVLRLLDDCNSGFSSLPDENRVRVYCPSDCHSLMCIIPLQTILDFFRSLELATGCEQSVLLPDAINGEVALVARRRLCSSRYHCASLCSIML